MTNSTDTHRPRHPMMQGVTPIALAGVVVYTTALMICGALVDGTVAFAFAAVAVVAVLAVMIAVGFFRALDDGDE
jgi:hypothetical protein